MCILTLELKFWSSVNLTLINGEQYGYDRKPEKPLDFYYVRHSIRCDKNDRKMHKKHVERGLENKDTP